MPGRGSKEHIHFRDLLNPNIIPLENTVRDNGVLAFAGLLLAQGRRGFSVEQLERKGEEHAKSDCFKHAGFSFHICNVILLF